MDTIKQFPERTVRIVFHLHYYRNNDSELRRWRERDLHYHNLKPSAIWQRND